MTAPNDSEPGHYADQDHFEAKMAMHEAWHAVNDPACNLKIIGHKGAVIIDGGDE